MQEVFFSTSLPQPFWLDRWPYFEKSSRLNKRRIEENEP